MVWFSTLLPNNIQKNSLRYLLQRYLGQFIDEKLTLDQLTVDLYNGIGSVSNVVLDVQSLNEVAEQQNVPLEFVDGYISKITATIPWSSLLTDPSSMLAEGLSLVIQPTQRAEYGTSMFESMWSSMTSSIQLAEECLKHTSENTPAEQSNLMNGVEEFARTIDSVLTRVKLKFLNTRIRLENLPKDSAIGGAIEIHIKEFTYRDETSNEIVEDNPTKPAAVYGVKLFSAEGVQLYTHEFHSSNRTISRSVFSESTMSLDASICELDPKRKTPSEDLILFGKFLGKQEVRLKIKHKENVSGPKTDLEFDFNTLALFLTPRQLRIVSEVTSSLLSPHLQDRSNVKHRSRCHQKPMTKSDFERVEHELNLHLNPSNANNFVAKSLQNTAGWSSGGVDEESDDDFHPLKAHATYSMMSESVANSVSSSYTSTASSYQFSSKSSEQFPYSQAKPTRHKTKSSSSESDLIGDSRRFEMRLNSLTAILLHRDVLVSSDVTRVPEESCVRKMQAASNDFFAHFVQPIGRQSTVALDKNHFRLKCTTVILNADEKSNSSNSDVRGSLSIANLELLEYLVELNDSKEEIIELIRCLNPRASDTSSSSSKPDMVVSFQYRKDAKRYATCNRTQLHVTMQPFSTEIDVTMVDRMVDILNNLQRLRGTLNKSTDITTKSTLSDVHAPIVESKFDWKISSPFTSVELRFPIPEMKDVSGEDEHWFWHRRNVYNDLLFVEMSELTIQSQTSSSHQSQSYEFQTKSARILFQESAAEKPVPFIFTGADEKFGTPLPNGGKGFDWPRLVVRVYPVRSYVELYDVEERADSSAPMSQSIIQTQKQEPSPFSAKLIKRESDTSHSNDSTSNCDGEEIILPGNKEEIGEFVEAASHNALLQFDLTLPSAVMVIPSKHFYELVYNRFNNDLMLWVPKAFAQSSKSSGDRPGGNVNLNFGHGNSVFTKFSMCKSTMKADSDSEDEDPGESLLHGNVEKCAPKADNSLQQSRITVSLHVGQGVVDVFPHARDSTGNAIPEQYGEIQVMFQEAHLFCVAGYKGEPLLNFVCLQINHCSLYHCSLVPASTENTLKLIDAYPSKYMLPTIYQTHPGAQINENAAPVGTGSTISEDMLTLSIRVQGQENRVKNICVANSLNCVTIRHRMKPSYTSWLSQLTDFFDIVDYPISHYEPWKVVTQLHQQLLNCFIDYRPKNLAMKAGLAVQDFNISSNITSKTATSILRFIAEEASLFISHRVSDERDDPQDLSVDLRSDYVCVMEVGLFELSLRLTDAEGEPQTDLRASNDMVHVRTCADSATALMDLVKYVAGDGDLSDEPSYNDEYCAMGSNRESGDDVLVDLQGGMADENPDRPCMGTANNASESAVPQLVEEAMMDEPPYTGPPRKRSEGNQALFEVYYFPNEENFATGDAGGGAQNFSDSLSSDDDLESTFCHIDREIGMGYMGPTSSTPEIRLLTKEPIRMVDNHFTVPINKVDVLKAPKGYPLPITKYTLREMTIVWHMYGGNDFPKDGEEEEAAAAKSKNDAKKHVNIASRPSSSESLHSFDSGRTVKRASADSINILYSGARSPEISAVDFVTPPSPKRIFSDAMNMSPSTLRERYRSYSWQVAGGVNRQHDASMELKFHKLKYQYEVYPQDTKQASRQVLIVQEVEISDRMATSQINKFLYQYFSSIRPKQSNANMFVLKATNIRPELNVSHRQECCLRVSLLPLRLNIDQDSLLFLINFFSEICRSKNEDDLLMTDVPAPQPVLNIEQVGTSQCAAGANAEDRAHSSLGAAPANTPIFIRSFIFSPDVPIRLDYAGKRVDMKHGPLAGLIMGLGQLNCSELKLKRLCNRHGFLGVDKLLAYIMSEWYNDIKKNQLPSILGGVGPMYSLVQLLQGIRDLFWLPIEQYQKDGRIVRGLQRGANSFTTSTAMAALELTARLVYAIQLIAETAFDLVSPGPSIRDMRYYRNDHRRGRFYQKYHRQPGDFREGVASALQIVRDGLEDTAQTLIRVASMQNETKGAVGAVGGIIREMPSAALTPIILATQATSNVLDGVRSHLVPDAKAEAALKWKNDYFN